MILLLPLILLVHLILLINTQFTLWPEMVVYPYLFNKGFLIYKDIINPYPPLLTLFLAQFAKIFGYMPLPYLIFTWGIISFIDLLIFYIAAKITKNYYYASLSTLFFVIFSLPFGINGLWFDLVQTPLILIATYYFYQYLKKPKATDFLFFSIFSLTIAFFIKQQVIWLVIWFIFVLFLKFGKNSPKLIFKNPLFFAPFLVLLVFQILLFWQEGTLFDFIYLTIYFPFFKASKMPGYILLPTLRQVLPLIALFLLSAPMLFKNRLKTNFFISTALVSIIFAYPRFDYFHLIPTLALLSVTSGQNLKNLFSSIFIIRSVVALSFFFLLLFTGRYFVANWHREIRFFEKDIIQTATFLEKIINLNEPIYIQNGPDQILPLAGRLPVKPWADEFPWYLEVKDVQEKVLEGLTSQDPRFIIAKPYEPGNLYEIGVYRPVTIADYIDKHYQTLVQISDTLWLKVKK